MGTLTLHPGAVSLNDGGLACEIAGVNIGAPISDAQALACALSTASTTSLKNSSGAGGVCHYSLNTAVITRDIGTSPIALADIPSGLTSWFVAVTAAGTGGGAPKNWRVQLDAANEGTLGATSLTILPTEPVLTSILRGVGFHETTASGIYFAYNFVFLVGYVPTISGVLPSSDQSAGGAAVTISGFGFDPGATVKFGSVSATAVVIVDWQTITCVVPPNLPGLITVVVTNPDGKTGSRNDVFHYRGSWYLNTATGQYQFATTAPGAPWVLVSSGPVFATLTSTVAAMKSAAANCLVTYLPAYSIRITSQDLYDALATAYSFGAPIIVGLSPVDAAVMTGASIVTDPSLAAQAMSAWPQIFVHPDAPFVLGTAISTSVGSGTITTTYGTPFGRTDHVCWQWRANVEMAFLPTEPSTTYAAGLTPPGAIPDGGLSNGFIFGTGDLGPCGGQ